MRGTKSILIISLTTDLCSEGVRWHDGATYTARELFSHLGPLGFGRTNITKLTINITANSRSTIALFRHRLANHRLFNNMRRRVNKNRFFTSNKGSAPTRYRLTPNALINDRASSKCQKARTKCRTNNRTKRKTNSGNLNPRISNRATNKIKSNIRDIISLRLHTMRTFIMISIILHDLNSLHRNDCHLRKMSTNNNFTKRRSNTNTIMCNINRIKGLHANKTKTKGRKFRRFYNNSSPLTRRTTLNSRLLLSNKRLFGKSLRTRITSHRRSTIAILTSFFGIIGTKLIFSFHGRLSVFYASFF